MKDETIKVHPKQPYFVMGTPKYYKAVVLKYGISHFYSFQIEAEEQQPLLAIPDGCVDLLFYCDEKKPHAKICGSVFEPKLISSREKGYYFGVRFLPGKVPEFCNISMSDILNEEVPLDDVMNDKELFERIIVSRDFEKQQEIFLKYYIRYYILAVDIDMKANIQKYMIRQIIMTAGNIQISKLSRQTGYSERYINKIFKESYGITPKVFCKMMRFQYLLDNLNMNVEHVDFSELAQDMGYYDQSHMMKDFKSFMDTTPRKYIKELKKENYDHRLIVLD